MDKIKERMTDVYSVGKSDLSDITDIVKLSDYNTNLNDINIKKKRNELIEKQIKNSHIYNEGSLNNSNENIQTLVNNYNNENSNKIIVTGSGVFTSKVDGITGGEFMLSQQSQLHIILYVCIILLLMVLVYLHYKLDCSKNILSQSENYSYNTTHRK
jgi:hypothetical protein